MQLKQNKRPEAINLILTVFALLAVAAMTLVISRVDRANNLYPFSEPLFCLSEDWELTDSGGNVSKITLPCALRYGTDGNYTLQTVLPQDSGVISSPALQFYSNYTDVKIYLDDVQLLAFPHEPPRFASGTGNTWQFVRLPADFAGRTLKIELHCQLGGNLSYAVKAPLLGAKATMLNDALTESVAYLTVSACMMVLAIMLLAMYFFLRRRLDLNSATLFLALFAAVFAAYVFCESSYAKMCVPNGHALYFCTFMLLAAMPSPLIGFFGSDLGPRGRRISSVFSLACIASLLIQMLLHFTGTANLRKMLPVTHLAILASMAMIAFCTLTADPERAPNAKRKLLSGIPMLIGGCLDILLLALGRPSFNNSVWLVSGVTLFVLFQFGTFLSTYFTLHRRAIEAELLRNMAFRDLLTGIANRNAYEQRLKELGSAPVPDGLCCIIADINNLKYINDTYGHRVGDSAIQTAGEVLNRMIPDRGRAFRTGGDEFVALLEGMSEDAAQSLAEAIKGEAARRGENLAIPLTLAVGSGCYEESDGNIQDFIRRVDSRMYESKRRMKGSLAPERL